MSLTNTAPLAAAETARDAAAISLNAVVVNRALSATVLTAQGVLTSAQTAYETEVLLRTPGAVGELSSYTP